MRLIAILMLALLAGIVVGEARMPEVGDTVVVIVMDWFPMDRAAGIVSESFTGVIENIDDDLLCMNCTREDTATEDGDVYCHTNISYNVCIGKGSIMRLAWVD